MWKLASDENLRQPIVVGLRRRQLGLDVITVREAGLAGAADPDVLSWAAASSRALLTHDARTMEAFAYERVMAGEPMPGVLLIPFTVPIGRAIDEILLVVQVMAPAELADRVLRLPL